MSEATDFSELIRQVRSGDETASAELVRHFEPFILRMVRVRMRQHARFEWIRHDVGSSDVCQSVLRSLFHGLRQDRYRFDRPADLERLLQVMIRFNVATKARRASVKLRELMDEFEQGGWIDPAAGPGCQVDDQDLIEAIQGQFTEEELKILTIWLDGRAWADIGRELGCTDDAARIRLSRAFARVRARMLREDRNGA
jgi:DNA-directed RNA polymerase specialized sigma24 family protein